MKKIKRFSIFIISAAISIFITAGIVNGIAFKEPPSEVVYLPLEKKAVKHPVSNEIWYTGVTRPLNGTTFTPSACSNSRLFYTVSIQCSATIGSNASGSVKLQYSINNGSTWNDAGTVANSNTVTLAVVVGSSTINTGMIAFEVPNGALCKFVVASTGTTTITWVNGVEVTYEAC